MVAHLHVLLVTGVRPAFRYFETVLGRPYVRLMTTQRWSVALDELRRGETRLLICETTLVEGPARDFFVQVDRALPGVRPVALLVGRDRDLDLAGWPIVPRLFALPGSVEAFNAEVLGITGYRPREARRYDVRLEFQLARPGDESFAGSSADLSTTGMLLETTKRLASRDRLTLRVLGAPELAEMILKGEVIREVTSTNAGPGGSNVYAIRFEALATAERLTLSAFLDESLDRERER